LNCETTKYISFSEFECEHSNNVSLLTFVDTEIGGGGKNSKIRTRKIGPTVN